MVDGYLSTKPGVSLPNGGHRFFKDWQKEGRHLRHNISSAVTSRQRLRVQMTFYGAIRVHVWWH